MLALSLSITLGAGSASAGSLPHSSKASILFPDKYDDQIHAAVRKYWPDYPDWLDWKAQLYQESLLNPDAVSGAGARGLAQFMPGTWADIITQLGWNGVSPHEAKYAIIAGAFYMAKLRGQWFAHRTAEDRQRLAQASYNTGLGNMLRAQRLCDGAVHWEEISLCLPQVIGHDAAQTQGYPPAIERWREEMQ